MLRALDRWAARLLLGAGGTLAAVSALFSAGSSGGRLVWIGVAALAVATAVVVGALAGLPRPSFSREAVVALGFFAAFVAWNGVSVIWSIEGDRSWAYFNRGLVYLAFAVVGLWLGPWVRRVGVRAGRRARAAARLGAAREGDSGARLVRARGAAELADRVLERARPAVRDGAAARPVAGGAAGAPALAARGRRGLRLRAGRRAAADLFARRRARGGGGRGAVARARLAAGGERGGAAARRRRRASGLRSGRSRGRGSPRTGSRTRCASTTAPGSRPSSCSRPWPWRRWRTSARSPRSGGR